jgi:formylglycine-generating enzyme required for sulfatase activity
VRAGTETEYPWDNEIGKNLANCGWCGSEWSNKRTAPVGSFSANAFGLCDTVGNVWEWTSSTGNKKMPLFAKVHGILPQALLVHQRVNFSARF